MWPLRVQAFQFAHQRMLFKWNELRTQSLISGFPCSCSHAMLCFCQLWVVFLNYSGIVANQMCQSLPPSLAKFLLQMLVEQFKTPCQHIFPCFVFLSFLQRKTNLFFNSVDCPRSRRGSAVDGGRQRKRLVVTSSSHLLE